MIANKSFDDRTCLPLEPFYWFFYWKLMRCCWFYWVKILIKSFSFIKWVFLVNFLILKIVFSFLLILVGSFLLLIVGFLFFIVLINIVFLLLPFAFCIMCSDRSVRWLWSPKCWFFGTSLRFIKKRLTF